MHNCEHECAIPFTSCSNQYGVDVVGNQVEKEWSAPMGLFLDVALLGRHCCDVWHRRLRLLIKEYVQWAAAPVASNGQPQHFMSNSVVSILLVPFHYFFSLGWRHKSKTSTPVVLVKEDSKISSHGSLVLPSEISLVSTIDELLLFWNRWFGSFVADDMFLVNKFPHFPTVEFRSNEMLAINNKTKNRIGGGSCLPRQRKPITNWRVVGTTKRSEAIGWACRRTR
jgi:hypothetical protein